MAKVKLTYTDLGKKLLNNIKKTNKTAAQVGFLDEAPRANYNGLSAADIAMLNNDGSGSPGQQGYIPARPFMTNTVANKSLVASQMALPAKMTLCQAPKNSLDSLGESLKDIVMQEIVDFTSPSNARSTIDKKGKDDPLRDTDNMLNSVTHKNGKIK